MTVTFVPVKVPTRRSPVAKCLFGRPDAASTKRLLRQAFEDDRQRFIARFGFDVVTGKPVQNPECCDAPVDTSAERPKAEVQTSITDFWKIRRTIQPITKRRRLSIEEPESPEMTSK